MRRATASKGADLRDKINFYPRSPCGERLEQLRQKDIQIAISIHALLAESDRTSSGILAISLHFYPRSPCGERLSLFCHCWNSFGISIHALLAESDNADTKNTSFHKLFLSTLSLRRATMFFCKPFQEQNQFLSTLSLRRATHFFKPNKSRIRFLSTLSLRRATSTRSFVRYQGYISIHALLAESDNIIKSC